MYGVSPKERMDTEQYELWLQKTRKRLCNQTGTNNPNYNNKTLHNKIKDDPKLRIQYYSRPGTQNGRAKQVFVYDSNYKFLAEFGCVKDCAEWIKNTYNINAKVNSMCPYIMNSARTGQPYKNLIFSHSKITHTC